MVSALELIRHRLHVRDIVPVQRDYYSIAGGLVRLQDQMLGWAEQNMRDINVNVIPGLTKIWSVNSQIMIQHGSQCFELSETGEGGQVRLTSVNVDHASLNRYEYEEIGGDLLGASPLFTTFTGTMGSERVLCLQLAPNPWDDKKWYLDYLERNDFADQTIDNSFPLEVALNYMKIMAKQFRLPDLS